MKDIGIKDDIPVIVVEAPDKIAKQVALVGNYARLNINKDDISTTVIDIYADHGLQMSTRTSSGSEVHELFTFLPIIRMSESNYVNKRIDKTIVCTSIDL